MFLCCIVNVIHVYSAEHLTVRFFHVICSIYTYMQKCILIKKGANSNILSTCMHGPKRPAWRASKQCWVNMFLKSVKSRISTSLAGIVFLAAICAQNGVVDHSPCSSHIDTGVVSSVAAHHHKVCKPFSGKDASALPEFSNCPVPFRISFRGSNPCSCFNRIELTIISARASPV